MVQPPSVPGASWLRTRMLAKVPRVITRSLPRREPYELNMLRGTPAPRRYLPAGDSGSIDPAGEMWSVVTDWPSLARTRAPEIALIGAASAVRSTKKGGSWM